MSKSYTGVRVIPVTQDIVNKVFKNKSISRDELDGRSVYYQNEYLILKAGPQQTALTKLVGTEVRLLPSKEQLMASGVTPRNKEQIMALDALLDDNIKVVVLTGSAGTGKTLLSLAAALNRVENKTTSYEGIILTRPMSWVGRHGLGALPGDVDEKFGPYCENYMNNIAHLVGGKEKTVPDLIDQFNMKFIAPQLMRGASWPKKYIIADEVQVFDHDEMVTLGTRVGEGAKIVIMGDLGQRDEKIAQVDTGIYKFVNSSITKNSPLVASIELIKCERSEVSALFATVFEK